MTTHSPGKLPLSRHPLFAPIVAGWFAALLGIGSFAVRTSVLENAVLALRIDTLVPAAVPPLGITARILLALALMVVGAALGYALARRFASGDHAAGSAKPVVTPPPAAATKEGGSESDGTPASAAGEDDDLARLAAAKASAPQRRRALTLDELPEIAPQPLAQRKAPSILNVGELEAIGPLSENPASVPAAVAPAIKPGPAAAPLSAAEPTGENAAARLRSAPLGSLGIAELVERFALALAARRERRSQSAAEPVTPYAQAPFLGEGGPSGLIAPSQRTDSRPFAMPPSLRQPGLGNIEWFDEAEEDAALDSLLPPKRAAAAPYEEPVRAAPWTLPPILHEDEEAALGDDAADGAGEPANGEAAEFSSLLDMKPSARQPAPLGAFVRIEDGGTAEMSEPVVVFPGQVVPPPAVPARLPGAPFGASPVATEAALREALSALHKMSGTG